MCISSQELDICLSVLQRVADDPALINDHARMKALIAKIHKIGKKGERQANRAREQQADREARADTVLVQAQSGRVSVLSALLPAHSRLSDTRELVSEPIATGSGESDTASSAMLYCAVRCYICKRMYARLHFFYHLLCPECAERNYAKRMQRADLSGRIALITGGRIKIGYQTALRLLRDGATVHVTTRFAHDARERFRREPDSTEWQSRLHVHALDLRHLPSVEAFAQHLHEALPHLDILIHNAAQTIKRPLAFYRHLLEAEPQAVHAPATIPSARRSETEDAGAVLLRQPETQTSEEIVLPQGVGDVNRVSINVNRVPGKAVLLEAQAGYVGHLPGDMSAYFPPDVWDADGQKVDTRPANSWALRLHEISAIEMLEVQLVNAIAPFLLNSRLKPLLLRSPFPRRFIVNVSAMEGQFGRASKTIFHPHTNMAKAALNMMTRTSAGDYAQDGIYMNSVDTGWITDENPYAKKTYLQEAKGFYTPLDIIDGMARIYDPIAQGINSPDEPLYGHFLKDYAPHSW